MLLGDLVHDDDAGVVVDALPGGLRLGGVAHDDRRARVVHAVVVHLGAVGEGHHGGVGLGLEDELAGAGDDELDHGGLGAHGSVDSPMAGFTFAWVVLELLVTYTCPYEPSLRTHVRMSCFGLPYGPSSRQPHHYHFPVISSIL